MKRLIRIYIRKKIWEANCHVVGLKPSDYDSDVEWVMQGSPFRWRTRLWVVTHSRPEIGYKKLYDWLIG